MPDEDLLKFSDLDEVVSLDNDDLFALSHVNSSSETGYTSIASKVSQVGAKVNESVTYSNLQTTSKTIVGAINEVRQAAGGGTTITGTLTAGNTTLTLTNAAITTTAIYFFFTNKFGVVPTDCTVSTGSMTLTFDEQSVDIGVMVEVR